MLWKPVLISETPDASHHFLLASNSQLTHTHRIKQMEVMILSQNCKSGGACWILGKTRLRYTKVNLHYVQNRYCCCTKSWVANTKALLGKAQQHLSYQKIRRLEKAHSVFAAPSHPLHEHYRLLPSGRRYVMQRSRTDRFNNSFIPVVITLLNKTM